MKIESIFPHPSEEDLDIVTLGPGVKCVVHKGLFKTGDVVKLVPMKTVKRGVICHGVIVKEENYVEFNIDAGQATVIIQPSESLDLVTEKSINYGDPLSMAEIFSGSEDILERVHIDDAEEDAKNFAEDE